MSAKPTTLPSRLWRWAEVGLALGLVLAFFLAFMAILSLSFPEGTGLGDLLGQRANEAGGRDLQLDLPGRGGAPGETVPLVAVLIEVSRRVKDKRDGEISWNAAHAGQQLLNRHAVQTFARSGATIAFDEASRIELGENALVIVRRLEQTRDRRERRAEFVVLGGELTGTVGPGGGDLRVALITGNARSTIGGADDGATAFRLVAGTDQSTTLAVYSGSAELEAGGRRVQVGSDEWVAVNADGEIEGPRRLPGAPEPADPADGAQFAFRTQRPQVALRWHGTDGDGYRVQIARDAEFHDLVHEARLVGAEFTHGNLAPGRYFWRVRGTRGEATGRPGTVREFQVVQDLEPPQLFVEFPAQPLTGPGFWLRGRTEPGAVVFVGSSPVPVGAAGEFEHQVVLASGTSVLVVEAHDAAGNAAYTSGHVHARLQGVVR